MPQIREFLIASVTPQNLERGVLWFTEHEEEVRRARKTNPWWQANTFVVEVDRAIKPSVFARTLLDFGYERASSLHGRGLFAVRGGVIEIWPVNTEHPYLIEFTGNAVSSIIFAFSREERVSPRRTKPEEFREGNFVVHADHGIGIFRGIRRGGAGWEGEKDYFVVEYAPPVSGREPDLLFVPTDQKERLTAYVGFTAPYIHRLGGSIWQRTKRKIREDAEKLARELLAVYAAREVSERAPLLGDSSMEAELRANFPFAETPDQLRAEEEILKDMSISRPMDRILCGDVGFGKTELAIRAALRVIASGRQVAVVAPTTVLAAQHARTFTERFQNLPVTIRMLSRLTPLHEVKSILAGLCSGVIDGVIGTHRLFSSDVAFSSLGLVVIDEEQRFGVRHKEHFKRLRASVDMLSLTATPIPRTLQFTLVRLRDISRLESPPPERLPIQTLVMPYARKTIAGAIAYEMKRGGQVYFLHNRIDTMGHARETLEKSIMTSFIASGKKKTRDYFSRMPRIGTIHGRMGEREMMRVMDRFRGREIDILLATTIIENGLDISSANTLIVEDATRLGLAQAHQLRGRIGRGNNQAFAYFLYHSRHLTPKALDRLSALQEYVNLGDGYEIALRDLELRGSGNILGREQSGAINKVGLNLYCQMLAEAVEEIRERV